MRSAKSYNTTQYAARQHEEVRGAQHFASVPAMDATAEARFQHEKVLDSRPLGTLSTFDTMRYVLSLLTFAAMTFGQMTPTQIGGHRIGETLHEWLAISHKLDNLDGVCRSRRGGLLGRVDKSNCEYLRSIRDGKLSEIPTRDDDRIYRWTFASGTLSEVRIAPTYEQDKQLYFQDEVSFLVQTYGKPSTVRTVPYHNAYGAHWESLEVYWNMPDGTCIMALEDSAFARHGNLLLIDFLSNEALNGMTQQTKPNPYQQ
jgi:hypothetical protein